MTIHVYSIMWNEEFMLPYFLRHYNLFADRIFIINDHSSDKTLEIAKKNKKVTILPFNYNRGLHEDDFNDCFEKTYKKYSRGRADWVMCVDADEFVYNQDIIGNLKRQRGRGVRIIRTTGFIMVSKKLPRGNGQIYEICREGVRYRGWDKPVVFDPALNVAFEHGRHNIKPLPGTKPVKGKLALLHYRYLSRSYFLKRSLATFTRTPSLKRYKKYRIAKGLKFYEEAIKKDLQKVI